MRMIFKKLKKLRRAGTGAKRTALLMAVQLVEQLLQRHESIETEAGIEPAKEDAFRVRSVGQSTSSVAPRQGFEPCPSRLERDVPPATLTRVVQRRGVEPRALPTIWASRHQDPRCGAPPPFDKSEPVKTGRGMRLPGHGELPSEQGHSGAQAAGCRMWLDDNSGQLVVEIRFEVERETKASGRGGRGHFGKGRFVGNGHQNDEIRDFHPPSRDQRMELTEFERGVRALRRSKTNREIGTSHDIQPVQSGYLRVSHHENHSTGSGRGVKTCAAPG